MIASLAAVAMPAMAQERPYRPTGTRIAQAQESVDPNMARRLMKVTARCVYRRNEAAALAFLRQTDAVTAGYEVLGSSSDEIEGRLNLGACMGEAIALEGTQAQMGLPAQVLRASLAEESYLARHASPLVLAANAPEILTNRPIATSTGEAQARGLAAFADCVIYHAPAEADALLRTGVGSDDERAGARAMVPAISQCLAEGQEANLTSRGIREMVADGLWSRSEYGAAAPTGE
ncbi:hypothetical protein M3P36_12775 [Altererythrobacter sp. KTW20L]|uniref:hypothetical protein n=1 Tax=Altererythrobacter sp. KTW20L TaxID=2942210 RepID=UPI0020C03686|nr:hypothetical protein [Altererythrobacter sp. KTW20L]MCL6251913.1 hypothetical protein [Altererythrobacter sp. KTW20L]